MDRNKARAMLAATPLLVAQVGLLDLRKKVMEGDVDVLQNLRLNSVMPVAETIRRLGQAPPMAVLKLCNRTTGEDISNKLVQHLDDLDFVQDVLTVTANQQELNPAMHGVIEGLGRRKTFQRFKSNNQGMDIDRLRFSHTATPKDSDLEANEVTAKAQRTESRSTGTMQTYCCFFNRTRGCRYYNNCIYTHKCIICNRADHGASRCWQRSQERSEEPSNQQQTGLGQSGTQVRRDAPPSLAVDETELDKKKNTR